MTIRQFIRTLPARWRAYRRGWAFTPCPICKEYFSCEDVWGLSFAACLMDSPGGGRLVCSKPACQESARAFNRARWGRDLHDDFPPQPPRVA